MRSKQVIAIALAGTAFSPVLASSGSPRPRGVGPEFAKFFKKPSFSCIFNPSITLEASQINDDFCDCPDGSDEPGTSACSGLSPLSPPSIATSDKTLNHTAALPGFYCKNKGHQPAYVPFTYVNDGVCDYELCCDGSDEWEGIGGVKCEDKCKQIGIEWRKHAEARQKAQAMAGKKRKELVTDAARLKLELQDKIANAKVLIEAAEIKVKDAEDELVQVEKVEKLRVVKAPKEGGKLGMLVSLGKRRTDDLLLHLQRTKEQRDDARARVVELEGLLAYFKDEYNPNFNDEGVKRAVRAWEDYESRGRLQQDPVSDKEIEQVLKPDFENGLVWEDYEQTPSDTEALYKLEAYLPKSMRDWVHQKLGELRVMLIENGILPGAEHDGTESKALQDARARLDAVKQELTNHQTLLQNDETDLQKDYGPDGIFRALKGQCVTEDSGEYTYEHCWMDSTTQKPKKGGMDTNMGYFTKVEMVTVDEESAVDGKGLGSGERIALKYENGAHCWNGPARSTTVILACAAENEIWKIVEEEKCVYRMEAGSPAACPAEGETGKKKEKDEL